MRPMPYFPFDKDLKKEGAHGAIEVSSLEKKSASCYSQDYFVHFLTLKH